MKSKRQAGGMLCAAVVLATNACTLVVNTSVPDDGSGGRPKSSGGASNTAGNQAGGHGGRTSGGNSGGVGGIPGSGGDAALDSSGGAAFSGAGGQNDGGAPAGGAVASGGSAVVGMGGADASGGTTQSGGAFATGATSSASLGGAGTGGAGTGGAGTGGAGTGGAGTGGAGTGGAGTGGSSSGGRDTGPCLGQPNEVVTQGWYINTGQGLDATIQPPATGSHAGLFQDGSCVCVSGSRGADTPDGWANVYFDSSGGVPFTSLSIKLINASPKLAWPTLYVFLKSAERPYCRSFSDDQITELTNGQTLTILNTDLHNTDNGGNCSTGPHDMPAGAPISHVQFQVDSYQAKLDFNFCVLKLTVNP